MRFLARIRYQARRARHLQQRRRQRPKTAAGEPDGPIWVVKAQIHAGGRGKGRFKEPTAGEKGGVRITKSVEEAADEAQKMLGRTLVTHQTGPAGKTVNRMRYIEDGFGHRPAAPPRRSCRPRHLPRIALRGSRPEGGMDIEEVAAKTPGQDPRRSRSTRASGRHLRASTAAAWRSRSGCEGKQIKQCWTLVNNLD